MTRLLRREDGQTVVEWGVVAAFISIAAVLLLAAIGVKVEAMFAGVLDAFG
jgi:Flp pilus assembly pilin Flp